MTYTLQNYQQDLQAVLSKSPHKPYERADEGLVYFVDVIRSTYFPKTHKAEFVTWLSLFVMIDLVFFTYYRSHYSALKEEFNTQKFEYGLTNTFLRPDDVLIRLIRYVDINSIGDAFRSIVPEFNRMVAEFAKKKGLSFEEIQESIFIDRDLSDGRFMIMYMQASGKDVSKSYKRVPKKIHLLDIDENVEINVLEKM